VARRVLSVEPVGHDDSPQESEAKTARLFWGAPGRGVDRLLAAIDHVAMCPANAWHIVFGPHSDVETACAGLEDAEKSFPSA
jgi:hypothetical protein